MRWPDDDAIDLLLWDRIALVQSVSQSSAQLNQVLAPRFDCSGGSKSRCVGKRARGCLVPAGIGAVVRFVVVHRWPLMVLLSATEELPVPVRSEGSPSERDGVSWMGLGCLGLRLGFVACGFRAQSLVLNHQSTHEPQARRSVPTLPSSVGFIGYRALPLLHHHHWILIPAQQPPPLQSSQLTKPASQHAAPLGRRDQEGL